MNSKIPDLKMETIIEQQRRYHEERELLVDAMGKEMLLKKSCRRDQVNSDHRLKTLLDRFTNCSSNLLELYEDKDGLRKEEIASLATAPNNFTKFYARLNAIEEFHRNTTDISIPMCVEFDQLNKLRENPIDEVKFTDEEGYGNFLDLNEFHQKYINLKGFEKIDYITYLTNFDNFFEIPKDRKHSEYKKYIESLLEYLTEYCGRVMPLKDINEELIKSRIDFEKKWETDTFIGWPKEASSAISLKGALLDLTEFSSWEELSKLGLDRVKSALMALNLKCGGTLEDRAKRLFSIKGKEMKDIEPNLFIKKKTCTKSRDVQRYKEIAYVEAKIYCVIDVLFEQRLATKENVQRRQARSGVERDESDDELSDESEVEGSDDDEKIYNPKNVPLDWDGKPIPYWLYKFRGLNITYSCEICCSEYKGPKAFQKHFTESKHTLGMRKLGIPNTAHFFNVTKIDEVKLLWENIKNKKNEQLWKPETMEEFEDRQGNVYGKKIYDDLKRQGLL